VVGEEEERVTNEFRRPRTRSAVVVVVAFLLLVDHSTPIMSSDSLSQLSDLFSQSLTSDESIRKPAEKALVDASSQQGFTLALIQLIAQQGQQSQAAAVRLAAAIRLKNICRQAWSDVSTVGERGAEGGKAGAAISTTISIDPIVTVTAPLLHNRPDD